MSITKVAKLFFAMRQKQLKQHYNRPETLQRQVLDYLTTNGQLTEYGSTYGISAQMGYDAFAKTVPVNDYESLKGFIDRMRHGEQNVLWPGKTRWFAKSSGTTNDKSKFIPVTDDCLKNVHYQGGKDTVAIYLRNRPDSKLFDGKSLILGGSHSPNYNLPGTLVGDLSAILIENINPLANKVRVPDKQTALLPDFEEKRERIAKACLHAKITNLAGVPSWMMSVLVRVLELSGKQNLCEVWPSLEVFFHGGIAFGPYRNSYNKLIPTAGMQYMETYNASEGFFGLQDNPQDSSMLLMLDYGVYYEFIPMDEFDNPSPTIIPLEAVETERNYAMVITTSGGLWRYVIGDTVRFTSTRPYKFVITGRTRYFINAFGEELIMDNAEKALAYACKLTGAEVKEYTAAPVFMDDEARCRHQWLIEFEKEPDDILQFEDLLDRKLQSINSDYEAKRHKNITLQHLEVIRARKNLFHDWLKSKGKLGGQHKVPRLSNSRKHMDELLSLNNNG